MKFDFDSPVVKRIISVIIALVLFAFVNIDNKMRFQSSQPTDGASITSSETISNLPIEVNIDTEEYFVSGVPDSVTLRIEGPQAILFQTVATQNFTVTTPDLNKLGEGSHSVELQVKGLSSDIRSSVSPAVVNLTIEEKLVEEFDVSIEIDEDLYLAKGYEIVNPSLSQDTVTISGAASVVQKIDRVIVELSSDDMEIKKDILGSAQVLVFDEAGNLLNVNVSPMQVEILAPVVRTQKEIPIALQEGNGQVAGYTYTHSLAEGESPSITVQGDPDAIAEISNFVIEVDYEGITESTLVTIPLGKLPEGIEEVDRDEVEVLIEVKKDTQDNPVNN